MKPFSWHITEGTADLMQIWAYSDILMLKDMKRFKVEFFVVSPSAVLVDSGVSCFVLC